ncbi:MAG TPA: hypothetical protein DCS93_35650 [Microscillaceae bacterium]|nr:hypothetical protein [Microscillaceae bacterium]
MLSFCFSVQAKPWKLNPEQIYQKIIQATGVYKPVPIKLTIQEGQAGLDLSDPRNPQLRMDQKLLNLAEEMGTKGEAFLAFFMAHQAAFYYNDLGSKPTFFALSNHPKSKGAIIDADRLGVIYAHLAGYPMVNHFVDFLKAVYQAYDQGRDGFYKERLQFAKKYTLELEKFFLVFETANYLTIIDTLVDQSHLYNYVIQSYKGQKIYNNAGVNQFKLYLSKLEEDSLRPDFYYPITLDVKADPHEVTRGEIGGNDNTKVDQRFRQSLQYFENALKADPNYAPAYLNLACLQSARAEVDAAKAVQLLSQAKANAQRALELADKVAAKEIAYQTLVTNAKVMLAIITFQENKSTNQRKANKMLVPLLTKQKDFVELNWRIINNRPPGEIRNFEKINPDDPSEQIVGIALDNAAKRGKCLDNSDKKYLNGDAKAHLKVEVDKDQGIVIYLEKIPQQKAPKTTIAHKIVLVQQSKLIYFLKTLPAYGGTTTYTSKEITPVKLGDNYQKISRIYGLPRQQRSGTLASVGHTFKIYRGRQIIFQLNRQFNLTSWLIYEVVPSEK